METKDLVGYDLQVKAIEKAIDSTEEEMAGEEEEMKKNEKKENQDLVKERRCGNCRRLQYGHEGEFGKDRCKLKRLDDDDELAEDDERKKKMRADKQEKIRKDEAKKKKLDELKKEEANLKKKLEEQKGIKAAAMISAEASKDDEEVHDLAKKIEEMKLSFRKEEAEIANVLGRKKEKGDLEKKK